MTPAQFRAAIQNEGWTFVEAARRIGVSEPTIRRLVSPSRVKPIPRRDVLALEQAILRGLEYGECSACSALAVSAVLEKAGG